MSDETPPDDQSISLDIADSAAPIAPDVQFVVPAAVLERVTTEEGPPPAPTADAPPPPPIVDAPPPADGSAAVLEAVASLGEALGRRLDGLQSAFEREVRAEATREKVVDRLHAELQEYKQDLLLKVLRPVLVDLIQLHDDIGKMSEACSRGEVDGPKLLEVLQGYQQGIEDILYRQGVEPFRMEGDGFDPRRQRAVATLPTDDDALNKRIAARLRKGFQAGDKMIRPEIVSVYAVRK